MSEQGLRTFFPGVPFAPLPLLVDTKVGLSYLTKDCSGGIMVALLSYSCSSSLLPACWTSPFQADVLRQFTRSVSIVVTISYRTGSQGINALE